MALVKISELPATTTVLDTQEIPTNNAGVNEKVTIGQIRNGSVYSITADYNISLTDGYSRIHFNHSASTKKISAVLPNVASSIGRAILFQNLASGYSYLDGNGAYITFKNNSLTNIKLFMKGDIAILRSNGTVWIAEHYFCSISTEWISRADWSNTYAGSAFTYDNKSAAVDLTGQHITEATSNQTAIVIFDSGGTGASGILYVYNIANGTTGIWTDGRQITCGAGGYTCDVNEGSGSSKNQTYDFYHAFGVLDEYFFQKMKISTDGTEANSFLIPNCTADEKTSATGFGMNTFYIGVNSVRVYFNNNGVTLHTQGAFATYTSQDDFIKFYFSLGA